MSKFLKALRDDCLILNSLVRSLGVTKIVVDSLLIFRLSVNLSLTF